MSIKQDIAILWFRNGLRIHDNPSLHAAIGNPENNVDGKQPLLLPMFIFDGETALTGYSGYNRMKFLLECLGELNDRFKAAGSKLHVFK